MPTDHKSRSENDWAFAKRALARGDDPETVIQRIADYCGEEKNSNYDLSVIKTSCTRKMNDLEAVFLRAFR